MTGDADGATADPRMVMLADHAGRALARQAARLDEHRTRAATLFSAGAIAAGFLGAEAFTANDGPGAWAWVGAILFVLAGCTLAYVQWPRLWTFMIDVSSALDRVEAENMSVDDANKALAIGLEDNYKSNETQLDDLTKALSVMVALLVGEVVAFFVNLALG
jgi:hypothetical protein